MRGGGRTKPKEVENQKNKCYYLTHISNIVIIHSRIVLSSSEIYGY